MKLCFPFLVYSLYWVLQLPHVNAWTVNCPYFHVLVGFGFSFLQFGHLAIIIMPFFVCVSLKDFMLRFALCFCFLLGLRLCC